MSARAVHFSDAKLRGATDMNENSTPLNADSMDSMGSTGRSSTSSAGGGTTEAMKNAATETAHGFADRVRDFAGSAQDKLADVGSTVRERAGTTKDSLADVLDS